jgi:hypothetical protein
MKNNLSHLTFSSTRSAPMRKVLCVVIALVATSCIAQADTVYTSQSAWNAAVSGSTTINFEGIASPSSYVNETPASPKAVTLSASGHPLPADRRCS